ncbi:MAG: ATP-binding protein [Actinomycetota bacterium]
MPDEFAVSFPGEGRYVEFKEGFSRREVANTLVAFSNDDGGVLLLGVTDAGVPKGFPLTGEREAEIHGLLSEVHDPGRYEIQSLAVGVRTITVIAVAQRVQGFSQTHDGRVLVRRGASNRPLVGAELADLVSRRSLRRFETTPTAVDMDEADGDLLQGVAAAWSWDEANVAARLREHHLLEGTSDGDRITVAGALYLLAEPKRVLGKSFVEVFRYRGEGPDYDRRVEIDGPLPAQVERATALVIDEVGHELVVLGLRRHELPRIPKVVLREAIANAVAHRSYETTGVAVRVEIRPDRVVIVSPGGLPEPVTVHNIREQSSARNVNVIATLRRFGLAEDAGRGVDVMQDEMAAHLLEPPEFVDDGSSVTVTLRLAATVTPAERVWIAELEGRGNLATKDRLLLVAAARGETLTNAKSRLILGVDSVAARLALQRLRDEAFLVQHGERGGAEYRISPELGPPPGLRMSHDDLVEVVLALASEGVLTNTRVRERTGLDRSEARALLARLVAAKRLEQRGERRGTHYVLPARE